MKIESSVLRRLGPIPFWRGEKKCLDELQRIYTRAIAAATAKGANHGTQTMKHGFLV